LCAPRSFSLLPKPREQPTLEDDDDLTRVQTQLGALTKAAVIPPYGQRKNWAPRTLEVRRFREQARLRRGSRASDCFFVWA
jgi:hypothetical protein